MRLGGVGGCEKLGGWVCVAGWKGGGWEVVGRMHGWVGWSSCSVWDCVTASAGGKWATEHVIRMVRQLHKRGV